MDHSSHKAETRSRDQERLALLVRAGEIFHQSLDVNETLDNVARVSVESFADLCLFDLLDERSERLFVTASAHRDPTKAQALSTVSTLLYIEEFRAHPVVQVTRTGTPFFVPSMDETTYMKHAASKQHERYMRLFRYRSKIVVPVIAQGHIFGALTFVRTRDGDCFDENDLALAIELGRRAGLAVANAKQFHRERNVAETLQRAFLPSHLPESKDFEITAHYRPGSDEADIGGDWYDAFEIANGHIALVIGDVTGKGVAAARLMVLLRQAIRIAALESGDPQHIARVCNDLLLSEGENQLASAFIAMLNPSTRELRYVSAGHAPPFLRMQGKEVRQLEAPSAPLGAITEPNYRTQCEVLPLESMLIMYTDGIIEAGRDVVAGEQALQRLLMTDAVVHAPNPAKFIERAIADQKPRDDIAVMVLKLDGNELRWQFEAADARAAYSIKQQFSQTLRDFCDARPEENSVCEMIFAELIGNVVRHAPGPLSVSLQVSGERLILHMIDEGRGFSYIPQLPRSLWSEDGRGLFLISELGRAVQVELIPGSGSHIAVTLPVTARRAKTHKSIATEPLVAETEVQPA